MNKVPTSPKSDLRAEMLLQFFAEQADEPGRKRDKLLNAVLKMIERGFWNPGDRLPTDAEFSQLLPLSVATIQAALTMAANQGIVVRKQKNGSFIASEENLSREAVFFNFRHRSDDGLADITFVDFKIAETHGPNPGQSFFGGTAPLLHITREVDIGGELRAMSELYLADPRLRILLDLDPETLKNLAMRPLLQVRFGLPSVRFDWRFTVETFAPDMCHALGLADGTIGQIAEADVYTVNDQKLMLHRMWIPPSDWALCVSS